MSTELKEYIIKKFNPPFFVEVIYHIIYIIYNILFFCIHIQLYLLRYCTTKFLTNDDFESNSNLYQTHPDIELFKHKIIIN